MNKQGARHRHDVSAIARLFPPGTKLTLDPARGWLIINGTATCADELHPDELRFVGEDEGAPSGGESPFPFVGHNEIAAFLRAVKSVRLPRVYLAGKMKPGLDWRGAWSSFARDGRLGVGDHELWENPGGAWLDRAYVVGPKPEGVAFELTGPFPSSCDHGCAHGSNALHMATTCSDDITPEAIRRACLQTILGSDLLCAHINTKDAYGTIAEVAWAVAHKIPVSLTFERSLIIRMTRGRRKDDAEHGLLGAGQHDLWFIEKMVENAPRSLTAVVEGAAAARAIHAAFIKAEGA